MQIVAVKSYKQWFTSGLHTGLEVSTVALKFPEFEIWQ